MWLLRDIYSFKIIWEIIREFVTLYLKDKNYLALWEKMRVIFLHFIHRVTFICLHDKNACDSYFKLLR